MAKTLHELRRELLDERWKEMDVRRQLHEAQGPLTGDGALLQQFLDEGGGEDGWLLKAFEDLNNANNKGFFGRGKVDPMAPNWSDGSGQENLFAGGGGGGIDAEIGVNPVTEEDRKTGNDWGNWGPPPNRAPDIANDRAAFEKQFMEWGNQPADLFNAPQRPAPDHFAGFDKTNEGAWNPAIIRRNNAPMPNVGVPRLWADIAVARNRRAAPQPIKRQIAAGPMESGAAGMNRFYQEPESRGTPQGVQDLMEHYRQRGKARKMANAWDAKMDRKEFEEEFNAWGTPPAAKRTASPAEIFSELFG